MEISIKKFKYIFSLKESKSQQDVFFGFTNTVLLCMALEYYEIGVDKMLLFLRPTSGLTKRLS